MPIPLPIPIDPASRPAFILLFGGTFDPPHKGHVDLPQRMRDELEKKLGAAERAWILYVPAARSPHKSESPVATDAERLEMLRLAIVGTPRAAIWTEELDRAREDRATTPDAPSYTVDTLRRARDWLDEHDCTGVRLRLLIGADQAIAFHRWRDPRDIMRLAPPVVMIRGNLAGAHTLIRKLREQDFWSEPELRVWLEATLPTGMIDISATQVREALRFGEDSALLNLVPKPVVSYIRARGLYQH